MNKSTKNKAVFFDRDGIIIKPIKGEAPKETNKMFLIKEIIPVLNSSNKAGFLNIIISNQPDVALGNINEKKKRDLEKQFMKIIKKNKLPIHDIYICNHHENAKIIKYKKKCNCRKPKSGMILAALKKWNIDPKKSFTLGDRASDVKAGKSVNTKTILYDKNNSQEKFLQFHKIIPDYKVVTLLNVIPIICKQ